MTITSLTIATLSPFMVADAQEKALTPDTPVAITYNWESQTATEGVSADDYDAGQMVRATTSWINGSIVIDDWTLA